MPSERLSMRHIRELLRLKFENGLPGRVIAASLGLSKGAVHDYLGRLAAAGLSWPLPEDPDRHGAGASAVPGAAERGIGGAAGAQLGLCRRRAAAQGRDQVLALAGISRRSSGGLRLLLVLPAL